MLNKVPQVTLSFWVIKIMSTTVGETGADYLAVHVGLGSAITSAVTVSLLLAALFIQLRMRRYVPWIYWLTVVLVSVVGTQITDALTDGLGVSLYASTSAFAVALAATFAVWYRSERTLSIHTIVTTRRELFYWAAILFTFALGTAAGDLATEALGLGFNVGVVVYRRDRCGLLFRRERRAHFLARLYPDKAAGCLVRRSVVPGAHLWRVRSRHRLHHADNAGETP